MGNEVNLILPHFALNDDHMDEFIFFDKAKLKKWQYASLLTISNNNI